MVLLRVRRVYGEERQRHVESLEFLAGGGAVLISAGNRLI